MKIEWGHPLLRHMVRRHLGGRQAAILALYTVIPVLAILALHMMIGTGLSRFDRTLVTVIIGELLVCWLVADHVFPELKRMVESRMARDLALTLETPSDIARILSQTSLLLSLPITAVFIIDGVAEWVWTIATDGSLDSPLYFPVYISAAMIGFPLTALLTAKTCTVVVLQGFREDVEWRPWLRALSLVAVHLSVIGLVVAICGLHFVEHGFWGITPLLAGGLGVVYLGTLWRFPSEKCRFILGLFVFLTLLALLIFLLRTNPTLTAPGREIPRLPFSLLLLFAAAPFKLFVLHQTRHGRTCRWPDFLREEDV